MTVFPGRDISTTRHVQATLHSPDHNRETSQNNGPMDSKILPQGKAQWSSGRILALGARDPRFEPGLGPVFLPPIWLQGRRMTPKECTGHTNVTSTGNTIFLETKVIHSFVNRLFNFLPIRPPLNKFIYILGENVSVEGSLHCKVNYLRSVGSTITRSVSHDLCEILCVFHDEDVTEHFEVGKICGDVLDLIVIISC